MQIDSLAVKLLDQQLAHRILVVLACLMQLNVGLEFLCIPSSALVPVALHQIDRALALYLRFFLLHLRFGMFQTAFQHFLERISTLPTSSCLTFLFILFLFILSQKHGIWSFFYLVFILFPFFEAGYLQKDILSA